MESPLNPPKGEVRLGDIAFSLLLGSRRRPKEDKTWKDFLPYLRKIFFRREKTGIWRRTDGLLSF